MSTLCCAQTQEGPTSVLSYPHKTFSIQWVKYQMAEKVAIKEFYNEASVSLFAELIGGRYLWVDFSKRSTQTKKVTKAYLVTP